ncbi:MAG: two-component system, chemotaxis family, protein-glutamate methylesterase/glutaminase [Gaiellaceae bacterium]|nr:two-component system, chemotaxis family, protein-glutamate methylesterase/glutaminase [Gaiellaceae bacterium]
MIGTSWGGLDAISRLLDGLHADVHQPIVVAQHRSTDSEDGGLAWLLQHHTPRTVADGDDKMPLEADHVYLSPPDYHVLVEDGHLALSTDAPVQFARPSIDVLFESVADAYGERAVGIVLTGANADGARGLARIKDRGGVAIVQDPATSERRAMPDAAIAGTVADAILTLEEIPSFLYGLCVEAAA